MAEPHPTPNDYFDITPISSVLFDPILYGIMRVPNYGVVLYFSTLFIYLFIFISFQDCNVYVFSLPRLGT